MTTAAVVLAAGRGERFGGDVPKLLVPFRGRPLAAWAIDAADCLDALIVVTGAADVSIVLPPNALVVPNRRWAEGQATSLAAGVEAAAADGQISIMESNIKRCIS